MFEAAELDIRVSKEEFDREVPALREALLAAQARLAEAGFSVVIVIAGAEGAGKGEAVNRLLGWLDARGVEAHGLGAPTQEESERPALYRFWRRLPPHGQIGIFFGSWYTRPIVDHVFKNYQGVLMVDGEVGNKKAYDPRSYLKLAEEGMAERVKQAVSDLRGEGKTLFEEA